MQRRTQHFLWLRIARPNPRHQCAALGLAHRVHALRWHCQLVESSALSPVKSMPRMVLSRRTSPHPIQRTRGCGAGGDARLAANGARPGRDSARYCEPTDRGRDGGRKFALSKAQVQLAQAAMAHRDASVSELCRALGWSLSETRGDSMSAKASAFTSNSFATLPQQEKPKH